MEKTCDGQTTSWLLSSSVQERNSAAEQQQRTTVVVRWGNAQTDTQSAKADGAEKRKEIRESSQGMPNKKEEDKRLGWSIRRLREKKKKKLNIYI